MIKAVVLDDKGDDFTVDMYIIYAVQKGNVVTAINVVDGRLDMAKRFGAAYTAKSAIM